MRELTNDHMKIISGGNANSGYDSKEPGGGFGGGGRSHGSSNSKVNACNNGIIGGMIAGSVGGLPGLAAGLIGGAAAGGCFDRDRGNGSDNCKGGGSHCSGGSFGGTCNR